MDNQALEAALEREHRQIDEWLERFADGPDGEDALAALQDAATSLRRHIYVEEEFLFPALRAMGLIAPVFVMLREHAEIWAALDAVEDGARNGRKTGGPSGAYARLVQLLEAHNQKEEAILYPVTGRALPEAEQERLVSFLQDGTLPEGWVCERLRGAAMTGAPAPR